MLVFLVGYMGSGKSSIGKKLAARLGYGFMDTDKEIERENGCSVRAIFEKEGEAAFRAKEREMLEKLKNIEGDFVIATGGGMPCFPGNIEMMNEQGLTIYFKMGVDKLALRLVGGRDKRPIIRGLNDDELHDFIAKNLEHREPFYGKARVVLECDDASDESICSQAVASVKAAIARKC